MQHASSAMLALMQRTLPLDFFLQTGVFSSPLPPGLAHESNIWTFIQSPHKKFPYQISLKGPINIV